MSQSVPEPASDAASQSLLLKPQLNPQHPLVTLAQAIDCPHFEQEFQSQMAGEMGRPPLPARLLVELHYLKAMYNECSHEMRNQYQGKC